MTNTSCFNHLRRRGALLAIAAAVAVATPAMAQNASSGNAAKSQEVGYSTWDISPYFGWQWFQLGQGSRVRPLDFNNGATFGARLTEDYWKYVSLEEGFGMAWNKASFLPFGFAPGQRALLGERNYQVSLLGVIHFTPRGSKIRPFVVVGPGGTWYQPSSNSAFKNAGTATIPTNNLQTKATPALVYGVGIKYAVNKKVGLRADLRGMWTEQPHFGLPNIPTTGVGSIYVPAHGTTSALQLTAGVIFSLGYHEPPPPPAPAPPPPPPPPPPPAVTLSGITGARDVCPGENVNLQVTAGGGASAPTLQWFINGTAAPGGSASSFSVPTASGSGNRSITVTATSGADSKTSGPVSVRIKTSANPTVQFALSQTTIAYGDRVPLAATSTGSECTDPVTIRYTASEGSIAGNTYDSSGVAFDMNNRLRQQSKAITITATATDSKGQTARATANLNATLTPQAKRYDDIVFPNNSTRVNNCGKRILLEQVTPDLRNDPQAKVILIGHRDNGERVALKLDDKRVLNSAAILSAGKGICPSLDLSRILIHSAGTDQGSQTRPAICGSSVTERSGSNVRDNDNRAQFRRVEVWVVPSGADMPAGTSGYTSAPDRETKALNCPR
jgi:outer membrane protein W